MRAHRTVELPEKLIMRVSEEQRARWERAALDDHRTLSDWARLALDRAAAVALPVEPPSKIVTKAKKRA